MALVLDPGLILGLTAADIDSDDREPRMAPGQMSIVHDRYGIRWCRYLQNSIGAPSLPGGLYSRAAPISITATAGSTPTLVKTSGLVAGAHVGKLLYVRTNASTAGAAPEGETAVIVANTATDIMLDSRRPLSAAPPTGTDIVLVAQFQFIRSAAGHLNSAVLGVGLASGGVATGNWGIVQSHGECPDVKCTPTAVITVDRALIAGAEQVAVSATSAVNLLIGLALVGANAVNSGKVLARLTLLSAAPLSA